MNEFVKGTLHLGLLIEPLRMSRGTGHRISGCIGFHLRIDHRLLYVKVLVSIRPEEWYPVDSRT